MSRFNTPEEVKAWAAKAAAEDYERHLKFGVDPNPYSTVGARNDWQRGFVNAPPYSWESQTREWDTMFQRGRAFAELLLPKKEV